MIMQYMTTLKFSTGWKIPTGEKFPLSFLHQCITSSPQSDHILIVGYSGGDDTVKRGAYKLPVANITASIDKQHNASFRWTELTAVTHSYVSCVPSLLQPVIVGGWKSNDKVSTADIKMYDSSDHSWKKIGSLSSGKSSVGVAAVHDNAIIIIGGWTKGHKRANYKASCLPVVELGQAELLH